MDCSESTHYRRESFDPVYEKIDRFMTDISENKSLGKILLSDSAYHNTESNDRLNYSDAMLKKILDRVDESAGSVSQKIEQPNHRAEENAPADIDQPTRIEMTSLDNYRNDFPVLSGTENTKRYLRNYVLNGRKYCDCLSEDGNGSASTRKDIDKYREKQLEFRDMIYGTSMNADDAVDKMARIALDGGFDANGQTISNIYDRLTCAGTDAGKSIGRLNEWGFADGTGIGSNKCAIPPVLDTSGPMVEANYIAEIPKSGMMGGKYYENYDAKYPNDTTDQMHPHDQMFEHQPMIE